jgi:hypothetical protein
MVPAIAFQIPDIAAQATLQLKARNGGGNVACIQSQVSNGKTASVPAVSYIAAGVAGVALVAAGVSAVGAGVAGAAAGGGTAGGMGTLSPSFTEVFTWFHGLAMNGMHSVNYPPVYRSFSKNFAFSTGLVPWTQLQLSIDRFREMTGGNLTNDSVRFLQNATLIFNDGDGQGVNGTLKVKRAFEAFATLASRQIETNINGTGGAADNGTMNGIQHTVHGIQAFVEQLSIPSANTFMTVLLVVAIAIAAIAVGILLVKVILEAWALFGNFPKSLAGFRKHYWGSIARAITTLIFLLYGVWVLYCMFQFTQGDSWAAKTLAGVTLGIFTLILAFFSWKIWSTARKLKKAEGDASGLYEEKSIWTKYSLFYDAYKKQYWWLFVPTIVYMFAKGVAMAVGDGHGMPQTIAQLIIEAVLLAVLVWNRPYERKSGNVINIMIQVVRVLSVVCILVFVEEFGIAQTTQTVTGVVLIAVQGGLTAVLAILIAWNAINACCKKNPHRQRRKEMEKMRDMDTLTPLDARNSLLLERAKTNDTFAIANTGLSDTKPTPAREPSPDRYFAVANPANPYNGSRPSTGATYRPLTPVSGSPSDNLLMNAAPLGQSQPTIPNLRYDGGASGNYSPAGGNAAYAPAPSRPYNGAYGVGGYRYNSQNFSNPYRQGPPSQGY